MTIESEYEPVKLKSIQIEAPNKSSEQLKLSLLVEKPKVSKSLPKIDLSLIKYQNDLNKMKGKKNTIQSKLPSMMDKEGKAYIS